MLNKNKYTIIDLPSRETVTISKAMFEEFVLPISKPSHLKVFPWMLSFTRGIVYVKMVGCITVPRRSWSSWSKIIESAGESVVQVMVTEPPIKMGTPAIVIPVLVYGTVHVM